MKLFVWETPALNVQIAADTLDAARRKGMGYLSAEGKTVIKIPPSYIRGCSASVFTEDCVKEWKPS
jgi:hypothetical protein